MIEQFCFSKLLDAVAFHLQVLQAALDAGGTTFSDFRQADGKPGYFKQQLQVYDRKGEACPLCGMVILVKRLGQRSTFYCAHCQT